MLKILVVSQNLPHVRTYSTILFENIKQIWKNKVDVHISWLIYQPYKLGIQEKDYDDTILDIHDFKNARDVVQTVKPDIIYALPGYSPIEYSFAITARFFKIPLVAGEIGTPLFAKAKSTTVLKSYLTQFFQHVSSDTNSDHKQTKRGIFFLYKFLFLLRTQKALKMKKSILTNIIVELKRYMFQRSKVRSSFSRFSCDVNFIESEKNIEHFVNSGFNRSSIVVVGNPTYDAMFQRVERFKINPKRDDKIRLLLVTSNPNDPGGKWTKEKRDLWLSHLVTEIVKHKDIISLTIKIHPTGEILSDYQSIVKLIDPTIPVIQHKDILDLIEESDVVLGTSSSTALVCSLIAKKPIIIWNIFNVEGDILLERKLALECRELSSLVSLVNNGLSFNPASNDKANEFIHDFLYKSDGRASERIAATLLELIKYKKSSSN